MLYIPVIPIIVFVLNRIWNSETFRRRILDATHTNIRIATKSIIKIIVKKSFGTNAQGRE